MLMFVVGALAEMMLPRWLMDIEPTRRIALLGMGIIDSMEPIMRGPLRLGEPISIAAGEGAEAGGADVEVDIGAGAGAEGGGAA